MRPVSDEVALYSGALALMANSAFLIYLLITRRLEGASDRTRHAMLAAVASTVLWALCISLGEVYTGPAPPLLGAVFDLARYGLWIAFLQALFVPTPGGTSATVALKGLPRLAYLTVAFALTLLLLRTWSGSTGPTRAESAAALVLPVCGLLMLEQLFRNLVDGSRWSAKPICLGLGCVFGFDLYIFAEALLLGRMDTDAVSMRSAVHTLSVPLMVIATRRGTNWIRRIQVSRAAAFYSATLVLAGGYLIFMSAIGYYVRYFGGSWGRALQLGLLAVGMAFLVTLVLSSSMRSWLRVFVGKHFFSYRYDYREEWLRFTAMLSSKRTPQEMGELIVKGLAKMVECPAGTLWIPHSGDGTFAQTTAWNGTAVNATEASDSSLCRFLRVNGWVIDLDEFRSSPRRYGDLALPTWLLGSSSAWLVVPLLAGEDLMGFVVLARPLTAIKLNWEVLDLLKTAGRQAAGYLAQMQATEGLLEARKFDAFNRMSAFVVHDLKNIVAQLSLMLKNAERLHDNAEFQQDMLLTVQSSLEKMKRLMLQLREGATPPGGSHGVELTPIVQRLVESALATGRKLVVEGSERLATRGHEDRMERVLGHLVQNAFDATGPGDKVWIRVSRHGGQVRVDVGDTGVGMSEEFVRTRLFRPFNTTKHSGMGIGTYESFQYIRELGGSISVDSRQGEGTVISVLLPLFEARRESDLMGGAPR